MVWQVFILLALCLGVTRLPWWTVFLFPAASVALGVWDVGREAPSYDMHGLGYAVGGAVAVICLIAWSAGRGARLLTRRYAAGPPK